MEQYPSIWKRLMSVFKTDPKNERPDNLDFEPRDTEDIVAKAAQNPAPPRNAN